MGKKLKVWSGLVFHRRVEGERRKQCEAIVCATSQKEAREYLEHVGGRMSAGYFRDYWCETGNEYALATATEPGIWVIRVEYQSELGYDKIWSPK